jgi:hypothetical protein
MAARITLAAACLALQAVTPLRAAQLGEIANQLTPAQIAEGWINLFDGETLFGWQATSDANWKVENGEIRVSSGNQGWLMTTSDFADFALHVEFKAPATTNSGVFLRTPLEPKDPTKDCIEVNIAPRDNPFPTPSLVGRIKTPPEDGGWLPKPEFHGHLPVKGDQMPDPWDGKWHELNVTLEGTSSIVVLDGVIMAAYYSEEEYYGDLGAALVRRGYIGLQFREGEITFRNIRLMPLGLTPMLVGEALTGWRTDEQRDAKFTSRDISGEAGTSFELQVTGGPGELETEAVYGDFVLQLDCFVDGDALNSGVFFRSIPGEFANGYESQIHNAVKDNDPAKPVDAGTGAIYRRTQARRVVSKDHEWFTKTIVATGPHIATWVNGYQVTDWTDDRAPDPNPRKGLRTDPGTISLQAHDPTTNFRFRNLRIVELPESLNHDDTTNTTKDN